MPGGHRFHRNRHGLGGGSHESACRGNGFAPLFQAKGHDTTLLRSHHPIWTDGQQLLTTVEPVGKIIQERVEKRLKKSIRLCISGWITVAWRAGFHGAE